VRYSNFRPGKEAIVEIGVPNNSQEEKTIYKIIVALYLSNPPIGGSYTPITFSERGNISIPPNGKKISFRLPIPEEFSGGQYLLRVAEIKTKEDEERHQKEVERARKRCEDQGIPSCYCVGDEMKEFVVSEKKIEIQLNDISISTYFPSSVIENQPFDYSVKIKNLSDGEARNIFLSVNFHHYFVSSRKELGEVKKEIGNLAPSKEREVKFSLTPTYEASFSENVQIEIVVFSSLGVYTYSDSIKVLSCPLLRIGPQEVKLSAGETQKEFTLQISNDGDTTISNLEVDAFISDNNSPKILLESSSDCFSEMGERHYRIDIKKIDGRSKYKIPLLLKNAQGNEVIAFKIIHAESEGGSCEVKDNTGPIFIEME